MWYDMSNHMDDGWGFFMIILWLVVLVNLILAGIWLLQQIVKK